MSQKIQIDGVGTVEVDDNFMSLPPDQQQRTVEEIAAHSRQSSTAPAPSPAAPQAPRGSQHTAEALRAFVEKRYPNAKFESGFRTPEHNREVNGADHSYHLDDQAVDFTGLSEGDRNRLYTDLKNAGVNPREFKFHNAGSGLHLHIAADSLPEGFAVPAAPGAPAAPADDSAPERQSEIQAALAQANTLLQGGKENEAIQLLAAHRLNLAPGELEAFHKGARRAGFNHKGEGPAVHDQPTGLEHDLQFYGRKAREGLGNLVDAPANIADLVYKGGQAIGGRLTGQTDHLFSNEVQDLPLPDLARPGQLANEQADKDAEARLGYVPEAANTAQRYVGAGVQGLTSALIPAAKIASAGKARAALAALTGGAASGPGGEAGADVAPILGVHPDKARFAGSVLASVAAGAPLVTKPISDARFVAKRVNDPRAPFAAKAVERMAEVADATKPDGIFPKGRGPLSVEQINSIGKQFLNEIEPRLADMKLSDVDKARFRAALKRRADLKPDEIEGLEGTPEGDAIAEGIRFFQTTRQLTPGYNGYKPGPIRRAMEMGISVAGAAKLGPLGAVLGPMVRRAVRGDPSDLNMSRLDAGRNALKRKDAWKKLGEQTGADRVGTKTAEFIKKHEDTVAANEAESAAKAQATAEAKTAREASTAERRDQQLFKESFPSRPKRAADPQPYRPSPTVTKAKGALAKLEERSQVGATAKAIDKLNAPPKPAAEPKVKQRPAMDRYVEENINQGVHGNYNAYADTLGVQRSDVLAALRQIKTDDIDPFEIQKLEHGYKLSPAGRAALIPRLQKQLKDSGVTDFRAKQAPSEKAPQISDKKPRLDKQPAEPATSNAEATEAAAPEAPDSRIRRVVRQGDYDRGTATYQRKADREIQGINTDPDIPNGRRDEVVEAATIVKDEHKTVESAKRWVDFEYVPKLEADGVDPNIIDLIQKRLHRVAEVGKKHQTQADLDAATQAGSRGRPRKSPAPSDDVPF